MNAAILACGGSDAPDRRVPRRQAPIVAANEKYLGGLETIREVVSAVLAILAWPLVLLGAAYDQRLGGAPSLAGWCRPW